MDGKELCNGECEIQPEHQNKCTYLSRGMGKENGAVHKKCLQGKKRYDFWLISGFLVWYLVGLRVVWLVCRWFVGSLDGMWVF